MTAALGLLRRLVGSLLFRVLMTLSLMAVVLSRVDWGSVGNKVQHGRPGFGALAIVTVAGALTLGGVRWGVLLRLAQIALPRRELFRIYAVTSFANAFLPTTVGGDVARPLMISRRGPLLVRAITTVVAERAAALVALIGLAWVGVALASHATPAAAIAALAAVSAGLLAATVVLRWHPAALRRRAALMIPERYRSYVGEAVTVVRAIGHAPRDLFLVAVLSVAFQALVTLQLVLLSKMINVDLSFGLAAVALALVTLATLIPISIGGFGVREGSYVAVLAGGGIGQTDAVLISLLTVVSLFFATLPGAFELVRDGFTPAIPRANP